MALKNLFETNEISGSRLTRIFKDAVDERSPAFITTPTLFYEGDVIALIDDVFYLSNTLSRDDIFSCLKNRNLSLKVAQGGTLYVGETQLSGIGRYRNLNILKLMVPEKLHNKDPRRAYRLRTFNRPPTITFTYKGLNVAKGHIIDVSMTGVGFNPDSLYKMKELDLKIGMNLSIDVTLEDGWKVSTFSVIRHITLNKIGVEYTHLNKKHKEALFQYIIKMRKAEIQNKLLRQERRSLTRKEEVTRTEDETAKTNKPRVLVLYEKSMELADFLEKVLHRRFDVFKRPFSLTEVREHLNEIEPDLVLFETMLDSSSATSRRKKVASAMAGHIPYMVYGESFTPEFIMVNFNCEDHRRILLDLTGRSTIGSYKKIEAFFGKK